MKSFDFSKIPNYKFYGFARVLVKPIIKLFFRVKLEGFENIPTNGGAVLASNHISNFDPVLIALFAPRKIHFMAKAELFKPCILRSIVTHLCAFPVNRGKGDTTAIDYSVRIVNEGHILGIFPEGTRSKDGKTGKAKSGTVLIASKTGSGVIPCAVIAKNGKIKLFGKIILRCGKLIPNSEIQITENKPSEIRVASNLIMDNIVRLMDEA